jgi:hypothetical protein
LFTDFFEDNYPLLHFIDMYLLIELISYPLASVLECHPTGSISALERVGKQWLQHAGDRLKYAEKKRRENE